MKSSGAWSRLCCFYPIQLAHEMLYTHTHTHTHTHTRALTLEMIVHIGVHLGCMDLDCSMKKATRTTCQCKPLATNQELTQRTKMTTAILDDPFLIFGQVSGSFRTLEVSVGISLAIARQVLEHQKLSCNLSRGPCNNLNRWHGSGRCIAAVQTRHVSLLERVKEQLDHTRLAGLH